MQELDKINEAAHWDYQRDRIYRRTKKHVKERELQKDHAEVIEAFTKSKGRRREMRP
jgi:hypothetical protein